jgi:hypothetical protein
MNSGLRFLISMLGSSLLALGLAPSTKADATKADVIYTLEASSVGFNWSFEVPDIITTDTIITKSPIIISIPTIITKSLKAHGTLAGICKDINFIEIVDPEGFSPGILTFGSSKSGSCAQDLFFLNPITSFGTFQSISPECCTLTISSEGVPQPSALLLSEGVPEPSGLLLLVGGLMSLFGLREWYRTNERLRKLPRLPANTM